jgi:hypothetical protein
MGERIQEKINKLCEKARKKLQPIFDRWTVGVDPKFGSLNRNRSDYALSSFANQSTTFYSGFFGLHSYLRQNGEPSQSFVGAHESRHLMPENDRLKPEGGAYLGDLMRGKTNILLIEQDADNFASKRAAEECSCTD